MQVSDAKWFSDMVFIGIGKTAGQRGQRAVSAKALYENDDSYLYCQVYLDCSTINNNLLHISEHAAPLLTSPPPKEKHPQLAGVSDVIRINGKSLTCV
jgi:hypothetical protein